MIEGGRVGLSRCPGFHYLPTHLLRMNRVGYYLVWFEFSAPEIVGMSVLSYPLGDINLLLGGNLRHSYNKQRAAAHTYTYLPSPRRATYLLPREETPNFLLFFHSTFFFSFFLFVECYLASQLSFDKYRIVGMMGVGVEGISFLFLLIQRSCSTFFFTGEISPETEIQNSTMNCF